MLRPCKASGWVNSGFSDEEKAMVLTSGIVPVNDVFLPLWGQLDKLTLLYGGFGSGKSVAIVMMLLDKCMQPGYFRCYYGRKVLEDVRGSVHATICDVIEDYGLKDQFKYSREPNGSMVVKCLATGNAFFPFGGSDAAGLKSIKDPTHFFMEEFDQFTAEDFGIIFSRLRTSKAKTQLYAAFNTAPVLPGHWILHYFFPEEVREVEVNETLKAAIDSVGVKKVFCNYSDNYFIDQEEYYQQLVIASGGDNAALQAAANGAWGSVKTGQEFYKQFRPDVHVKPCKYNENLALHNSWDDNVNPYLPTGLFQLEGKKVRMIDEIAGRSPNNNVEGVCKFIEQRFMNHRAGMFVYGDATARKEDTKLEKGYNFYRLVTDRLAKYKPTLRVSKSNPSVIMRGNFLNHVLHQQAMGTPYLGCELEIDPRCVLTITDLSKLQQAADGSKHKAKKTDSVSKVRYQELGHFSDLLDYILVTVWASEYEHYQRGGKLRIPLFGKNKSKNTAVY